jgi:hypothetical protein
MPTDWLPIPGGVYGGQLPAVATSGTWATPAQLMPQLVMRDRSAHYGTVVPRGAYRGSFVRRFNCTVASTASMRSPPAAMA